MPSIDELPAQSVHICISPHPDDTELGMGATLHKFRNGIAAVKLVVLSDRARSRREKLNRRDQKRAGEILGVSDIEFFRLPVRFFGSCESRDRIRLTVSRVVDDFKPDVIFTPGLGETVQDHQAVAEEVVTVICGKSSILGYEVIRHNRFFTPSGFFEVSEIDLNEKIPAVNSFSEFANRYYFEPEALRALASVRAIRGSEVYRLVV
jgi:LmbE family N-acetylglucosaminyl deacetylase